MAVNGETVPTVVYGGATEITGPRKGPQLSHMCVCQLLPVSICHERVGPTSCRAVGVLKIAASLPAPPHQIEAPPGPIVICDSPRLDAKMVPSDGAGCHWSLGFALKETRSRSVCCRTVVSRKCEGNRWQ